MQLIGTPLSHFTRKVRILAHELAIPLDVTWMGGVLDPSPRAYGDNPLMRVPTLIDGDVTLIESDHIARYLVARFDPADRLAVRSERVPDLNRLAAINQIMANEVVVILARRGGLADTARGTYFDKLLAAIDGGLAWLDAQAPDPADPADLDYRDIALVCMWQHLAHYQLVSLAPHARLAARVARFADRPSVASTAPRA